MQDMGVDALVAEGMESGGLSGNNNYESFASGKRCSINSAYCGRRYRRRRGMAAAFVLGAMAYSLVQDFCLPMNVKYIIILNKP
jgi:hypothetical protein